MTIENSLYSNWDGRIGLVVGAAILGFMFNQIWNLQSTISITAIKLGELTTYSNETLINTRHLIQQGSQIAAITNEQLRALEARVNASQQDYAQVLKRLEKLESAGRKP